MLETQIIWVFLKQVQGQYSFYCNGRFQLLVDDVSKGYGHRKGSYNFS